MPSLTHAEREKRRLAIADYCRTNTAAKAMKKFGVGTDLVRTACAVHGVTPVAGKSKAPDRSRLRLIAALLNTTTSYAHLAKKHGVTRQAVQSFAEKCVAAGLKVKSR